MNEPIQRFANLAREYVEWAEDAARNAGGEAGACLGLLARLYAAALELPDNWGGPAHEAPEVPKPAIERVFQRFANMPFQFYWQIFDAVTPEPEEAVLGDLRDDLADIYADLRAGLEAYDKGDVADAVFWWRTLFFHWGRHLTSALHAVHCCGSRA